MSYTVTTTGAKRLQSRLVRITQSLSEPKQLWDMIGFAMVENTRNRMYRGVDVNEKPFKPVLRGGQPLIDTGRMVNAIDYYATKRGVKWGVTEGYPWAWVHNEGAVITPKHGKYLRFKIGDHWVTTTRVKIPKRQFLGLPKSDKAEIIQLTVKFLQEGAK